MVRLTRIYTKTGDDGTTALGDGSRLVKHHLRIQAYGTVDELSSLIGLALVQGGVEESLAAVLRRVQNGFIRSYAAIISIAVVLMLAWFLLRGVL